MPSKYDILPIVGMALGSAMMVLSVFGILGMLN